MKDGCKLYADVCNLSADLEGLQLMLDHYYDYNVTQASEEDKKDIEKYVRMISAPYPTIISTLAGAIKQLEDIADNIDVTN